MLRRLASQPGAAAAAAAAPEAPLPAVPLEQHSQQGAFRDLVVPLYDLNRQQVGTYTLGGDVFDVPIRRDLLHRVVRWSLAAAQQGTHKTKTRSEVRGGGRKPRPQKGSGNSRQGTIRAAQWRGGGVVHGPVPRSHAHKLNKRVRRLGLKCALSAKAWEGRLLVVDSLRPAEPRTKVMDAHLDVLLADAPRRSVLLVDTEKLGVEGQELRRATSNLPWVDVMPSVNLNVYRILQRDYLVLSRAAIEALTERLRRPVKPWDRQ